LLITLISSPLLGKKERAEADDEGPGHHDDAEDDKRKSKREQPDQKVL